MVDDRQPRGGTLRRKSLPTDIARALCATIVLCVACTPPPGPADPFSGGVSPARDGVRQYTVRLEVGCDYCVITLNVGPDRETRSEQQVWSRRLSVTPLQPTAIRLSATPVEDGRSVRWVRIWVDGELVAEDGCRDCDATAEVLSRDRNTRSAETVIPRRR